MITPLADLDASSANSKYYVVINGVIDLSTVAS
jgi:hypothetical protein